MGQPHSDIQDFHQKYTSHSFYYTQNYSEKDPKSSRDLYQAAFIYTSKENQSSLLQKIIRQKTDSNCPYLITFSEVFQPSFLPGFCQSRIKTILVYLQSGINLYQMLKIRENQGITSNDQDTNYMLECVLRGYQKARRFGDSNGLLTPSCIVLDNDYRFKLIDAFLIPEDGSCEKSFFQKQTNGVYGIIMKENYQAIRLTEQKWKKCLQQIQEKSVHSHYTSLLSLGCIALKMLFPKWNLHDFFSHVVNPEHGSFKSEFDWVSLRAMVKMIKNQSLREKIWILISQYQKEREEVFDHLSSKFIQQNYPIDLLLKNTTIKKDLQIAQYIKRNPNDRLRFFSTKQKELNQSIVIPYRQPSQIETDHRKAILQLESTTQSQLLPLTPSSTIVNLAKVSPKINAAPTISFSRPKEMRRSLPLYNSNFQQQEPHNIDNNFHLNIPSIGVKNVENLLNLPYADNKSTARTHTQQETQKYFQGCEEIKQWNFSQIVQENNQNLPDIQMHPLAIPNTYEKLKSLSDLLEDEEQSFVVGPTSHDGDAESETAERVEINSIFPGYSQWSPILPSMNQSPINLRDSIENEVINEVSEENSQSDRYNDEAQYVQEEYHCGSKYEGFVKNGQRQGQGRLIYKNGQMYDGQWHENKMHGFGKLFESPQELVYEGYWKNDMFQGRGQLYNLSPTTMKCPCDYTNFNLLEKQWKHYSGDFISDSKQGRGRLTLSNNQYYEGQFKQDQMAGQGYFSCSNGQIIHGVWKNSILIHTF